MLMLLIRSCLSSKSDFLVLGVLMFDVSSVLASLGVFSLLGPSGNSCSCWQGILLAGIVGIWCGVVVGILITIFLCSPSLRQALFRGARAFWGQQVPEPNRGQGWRGGVDLNRFHFD